MQSNRRNHFKTETRVETRAVLKQLNRRLIFDSKDMGKLNKNEVAAFAATNIQKIWLACDMAELRELQRQLEFAFIEAYQIAGGRFDEDTKIHLGMA